MGMAETGKVEFTERLGATAEGSRCSDYLESQGNGSEY